MELAPSSTAARGEAPEAWTQPEPGRLGPRSAGPRDPTRSRGPADGNASTEPQLAPPAVDGQPLGPADLGPTPRTAVAGARATGLRAPLLTGAIAGVLVLVAVGLGALVSSRFYPGRPSPTAGSPIAIAAALDAGVADAGAPVGPMAQDAGSCAGADGGVATDIDANAADSRATLELTAVPWGSIWIDGRRVGDAHVVRRVAAGSHRVGAGSTSAAFEVQTVVLAPGERRRLSLRAAQ